MSARIIACSDLHLDARSLGEDRFDDVRRALQEVLARAHDMRATDLLCLGDICDPDCGTKAWRIVNVIMSLALRAAELRIRTHWLAGNHDVAGDGTGTTTLSPLRALAVDGPGRGWVHVYEAPGWHAFDGFELLALPFTEPCASYDPTKYFDHHACEQDQVKPVLVLSHLNLEGIAPGSETTDFPRGRDVFYPIEQARDWAEKKRAHMLQLSGHYHAAQEYEGVQIVGSLERLAFGEQDNEPQWIEVEL